MTPQNYELGKDEIRKVDWAMAQVQEELRELTSSVESPAAAKTDGDNPEAEDTNPKTEEVSTEPVDTTAKTDNNTENVENSESFYEINEEKATLKMNVVKTYVKKLLDEVKDKE